MSTEPVARKDVKIADTWDLSIMYPTEDHWQKDLEECSKLPEKMTALRGKASESAETLLSTIETILEATRKIEKVMTYAHMVNDQDLSDPRGSEMNQKAMDVITRISASLSWFNPEVLSVPEEEIKKWISSTPLKQYDAWLEDILRNRPYTLTAGEEKILALASDATRGFMGAFGKLNNVDIPARLPEVEGPDGRKVKLSHGNFIPMLQEPDRDLRKRVFKGFYNEMSGNTETLGAILDGQVRTNIFRSRARSFPSALESSLFNDRVNRNVYESLISSVHQNLHLMHRYYRLKKRSMGLERMNLSDVYTPTVCGVDRKYSITEGEEMVLAAVKPLGSEYVNTLSNGLKSRWVDRYENKGKRSGAYSGGCYDSPPYMLLNYSGTLDSVFTLAHEAGHSMHSWLSRKNQPYHSSDYKILVAEVASITNEILLAHHLKKNTTEADVIAYLVDSQINDFRTTLFRQTMFAEFELIIHERVESGESLSAAWLSEKYMELVKLYHGDAFEFDTEDQLIKTEWARIPHFYYNFYVYKYATGMASAASIGRRILEGVPESVEKYLGFLSSGGSRPPLDLLRGTGIDLETPEPVNDAMKMLDGLVTELETKLAD
ncbi:oligoendopeptidase F [Candidatus Fermentibacteria bacterium]|nr:MAG: oligoendopeptidase F [Candidatus Fermentibacteria bacterium]